MGDEMDRMAWPRFSAKAEHEALKVLRSGRVNYWTGTRGREFEAAFAKWLGAKRALAVSSGTAALHLALEALGVGRGDDVVVTPYSFRASATAVANAGARAVFADVGPDHMLNARTIAAALTPRTRAVVVVHLYGQVAEMAPILALARKRGIFVVEDCAQCLGGEYRGRKVGTLGDAGCFSFCQSKHITTAGEGGMVVCRSAKVARAVESLRDHGWKVGSAPKEYDRIGYNARLTEVQSAVGLCELERLESWNLPRRRRLAERLIARLRRLSDSLGPASPIVGWPVDTPGRRASFWLVPFVLDPKRLKVPVARFVESLQAAGAPAYRILWPLMAKTPVAAALAPATVGFWAHPTLSLADMDRAASIFSAAVCAHTEAQSV